MTGARFLLCLAFGLIVVALCALYDARLDHDMLRGALR